jgi:hypothetical protein
MDENEAALRAYFNPERAAEFHEARARFLPAVVRLVRDLGSPLVAAVLMHGFADALAPRPKPGRGRPKGRTDYNREALRRYIREMDDLFPNEPRARRLGNNPDTALAAVILKNEGIGARVFRRAKAGHQTKDAVVRAVKRERAAMEAELAEAGRLFGLLPD